MAMTLPDLLIDVCHPCLLMVTDGSVRLDPTTRAFDCWLPRCTHRPDEDRVADRNQHGLAGRGSGVSAIGWLDGDVAVGVGGAKGSVGSNASGVGDMPSPGEQVDAEGVEDFEYRLKTRFCTWGKCLVEAFATYACSGGNLCHPSGFCHVADLREETLRCRRLPVLGTGTR